MNLENQKFGEWTAISPLRKNNRIYWHCVCSCGKEKDVLQYSLTHGDSKSCGHDRTNNAHIKNLLGQTFGSLTVIEQTDKRDNGAVVWKCKCVCGNIVEWDSGRLKDTKYPNCGCKHDLTGKRFGKIVVESLAGTDNLRNKLWNCKCDCGNTTIVRSSDLLQKKVIGCGCTKSIGEYNITQCLTANNISFSTQYSFNDLKDKGLLKFDFAIFKNDQLIRLIEFDGLQHTNNNMTWYSKSMVIHDQMKNEYARLHNIPLVRIPYTQRDNITIEMLMGDDYLI